MRGHAIEIDDPRRDDVRRLLEDQRTFASGVMPPEGVHVLAGDDAGDNTLTFFSLRVDGDSSVSRRSGSSTRITPS